MTAPKNPKETTETSKSATTEKKDSSEGIKQFLSPAMQQMLNGAEEVTLEDIESLKNFEVTDSDRAFLMQQNILEVKDLPQDLQIGHLVFRWLNPVHRAKAGMGKWRWVTGELAKLVRQKRIVTEATGGGSSTSAIVNGDLMLAFMPRSLHEARKNALRSLNASELDTIMDRNKIESELDSSTQELSREVSIRKTYEGREVK